MKRILRVRQFLPLLLVVLLLISTAITACGNDSETLTVLAGSELRDLEPLFDQIQNETGMQLEMKYIGTLDGAEALMAGEETDLAWFSHGKYLTLLQGANARVLAQEKIMLSPVIMGVKESKARAFGWVDNPNITWRDIAAKAESGELHYAMTNPASSNSGFTALVGVAAAFAGGGDALQVDQIDAAAMNPPMAAPWMPRLLTSCPARNSPGTGVRTCRAGSSRRSAVMRRPYMAPRGALA